MVNSDNSRNKKSIHYLLHKLKPAQPIKNNPDIFLLVKMFANVKTRLTCSSVGEPIKMRTSSQRLHQNCNNLKLKNQLLQWVVWCKNVSKTKNHTSILVQYNLHVIREQSKTTIATITTEPCIRPSCSHFVPDTAAQSSLRNLFSTIRHYFCFYIDKQKQGI